MPSNNGTKNARARCSEATTASTARMTTAIATGLLLGGRGGASGGGTAAAVISTSDAPSGSATISMRPSSAWAVTASVRLRTLARPTLCSAPHRRRARNRSRWPIARYRAGSTYRRDSMNHVLRNALAVAGLVAATSAAANVTFYEQTGFAGRSFTTSKQVQNFERSGFNDRASSVVVSGERWEVCEDARFAGRCVVLRPGN